ncbi:MAG: hypothetical protein AB1324_00090 [Candidatus Micrarchaeota archaeon]
MCIFGGVLGDGQVLVLQALTALSIAGSIVFWVLVYGRAGIGLRGYAVPIALWVVLGTLDILITAKGTFKDPLREGNPLAELIFVKAGYIGPVVASVLWIALWSGIVLAVNVAAKKPKQKNNNPRRAAEFVSLAIFYSLATGHLSGFSSWFLPFCPIARAFRGYLIPVPGIVEIIFFGIVFAGAHMMVSGFLKRANE